MSRARSSRRRRLRLGPRRFQGVAAGSMAANPGPGHSPPAQGLAARRGDGEGAAVTGPAFCNLCCGPQPP